MANKKQQKSRIAFVKFGGMAAGGTEKYLQIIAAQLPKDKFDVDYYYCDAAPYVGSDWKHPDTDADRLKFMEGTGVNLIKFNVGFKNVTVPTHDWIETNFWDVFDESKYDIVQTGRAGHPEYPFTKITDTPIVDSIHLPGMVDNQANVAKVIHISDMNAQTWMKAGGNPGRVEVIYLPIITPTKKPESLREELGIGDQDYVIGLHQRDNEEIYSEWPIGAFQEMQKYVKHHDRPRMVHFVLLGGSQKHREQGKDLPNFHVLPYTGNPDKIWAFLETLDVYTHGRRDGEVNSQCIAEAMYCGCPIVSHRGATNGHIETVADAGHVHEEFQTYVQDCINYYEDANYFNKRSEKARAQFAGKYNLETNIGRIVKIYDDIIADKNKDEMSDDEFWDSM